MSLLSFTRVLRGGKDPDARFETREVASRVSRSSDSIDFLFALPAGDGGSAPVRLQVGLSDLERVLHEVAAKHPESARLFAECTSIAIKSDRQTLQDRLQA